jgi:hypothetical protein
MLATNPPFKMTIHKLITSTFKNIEIVAIPTYYYKNSF